MRKRIVTWTAATLGLAAALAFGAGIVNSAIASSGESEISDDATSTGAPAGILSVAEIVAKLAGQGYTDVYKIERESDVYEIKARQADGAAVELSVDARTGEVLRGERDD